jgi:hypothetical protein
MPVRKKNEDFDELRIKDSYLENKRSYDDNIEVEELNDLNKRNDDSTGDNFMKQPAMPNEDKVHKKRLETIDGVEIASSYKEYIELAVGDLDDRLRKNSFQMDYYMKLIKTRNKLFDEIENEIIRRHSSAEELHEKHKTLRDRLTHNTKMKGALLELANIAGFKLKDKKMEVRRRELNDDVPIFNENKTLLPLSIASTLLSHHNGYKSNDNNSYNQYIEMAFSEVNSMLTSDKQTLIEVIRQKKDNDKRLKMLETLKLKVENSLNRFKLRAKKLEDLIKKESETKNVLLQLKNVMQQHKFNFLNFVTSEAKQIPTVTPPVELAQTDRTLVGSNRGDAESQSNIVALKE